MGGFPRVSPSPALRDTPCTFPSARSLEITMALLCVRPLSFVSPPPTLRPPESPDARDTAFSFSCAPSPRSPFTLLSPKLGPLRGRAVDTCPPPPAIFLHRTKVYHTRKI